MKAHTKTINYTLEAGQFEWEIAPGKIIEAWGFNGTLPGQTLRAKKGDTLSIKVKNNLTEPTIVHWHGIRLPSTMDGTDDVQKPIAPGEEFEYRFVVPDAGTFWYHSHQNETVQMERGMYGALIVEDDNDPKVDADRVFMLDDMKLNDKMEFTRPSWFLKRWLERHDGREGNTFLINGKEKPVLSINAGQVERWRIINSSSARYVNLSLGRHKLRIIATDGGLIERIVEADELLLTPGERVDIIAGPFNEGEEFNISSTGYVRSPGWKKIPFNYATVVVGSQSESTAVIPSEFREIEPIASQHATVNRTTRFSTAGSFTDGVDFLVNGKKHMHDQPVKVGETQVWEIFNASLMDHPYHLHGFFFQVIDINGKAPAYRAWKDTINIPPRSRVKIAWIPDNRPGMWMYHCHILEHHAAGMMAHFEVVGEEHVAGKRQGIHMHHMGK
jgi:FtsP/CotA-like multicopper oxidase with cupredoxin domain